MGTWAPLEHLFAVNIFSTLLEPRHVSAVGMHPSGARTKAEWTENDLLYASMDVPFIKDCLRNIVQWGKSPLQHWHVPSGILLTIWKAFLVSLGGFIPPAIPLPYLFSFLCPLLTASFPVPPHVSAPTPIIWLEQLQPVSGHSPGTCPPASDNPSSILRLCRFT